MVMKHPLVEAIGATDSLQERQFCLALIPEGPDVIERILRRYLDMRDGRVETPEPFGGSWRA